MYIIEKMEEHDLIKKKIYPDFITISGYAVEYVLHLQRNQLIWHLQKQRKYFTSDYLAPYTHH